MLFMALLASVFAALACAKWFTRNRLIQDEPVRKDSEARVGVDANQTLLHKYYHNCDPMQLMQVRVLMNKFQTDRKHQDCYV